MRISDSMAKEEYLNPTHNKIIETLEGMEINTPDAFNWQPEKTLSTMLDIKDAIEKIQRLGGTKELRQYYMETYKSRQTYYNHQKVLNTLIRNIEISELENLTASKFHVFYLRQFGIENSFQNKLF